MSATVTEAMAASDSPRRGSTNIAARASRKPSTRPPRNSRRKTSTTPPGEPGMAALESTRLTRMPMKRPKAAMATASFSSDSPSARIDNRLGAPTSRKMLMTAAGSVVDTTAPSSRQTTRSMPVAQWTTKPTEAMHTTTATMASSRTAWTSSISRRTSMLRPAVNSNGGRNKGRNMSAPTSSLSRPTKASPSAPSLTPLLINQEPRNPMPIPAIASRTVCGRRKRSATGTSRLTTTSTIEMASRA